MKDLRKHYRVTHEVAGLVEWHFFDTYEEAAEYKARHEYAGEVEEVARKYAVLNEWGTSIVPLMGFVGGKIAETGRFHAEINGGMPYDYDKALAVAKECGGCELLTYDSERRAYTRIELKEVKEQ